MKGLKIQTKLPVASKMLAFFKEKLLAVAQNYLLYPRTHTKVSKELR